MSKVLTMAPGKDPSPGSLRAYLGYTQQNHRNSIRYVEARVWGLGRGLR